MGAGLLLVPMPCKRIASEPAMGAPFALSLRRGGRHQHASDLAASASRPSVAIPHDSEPRGPTAHSQSSGGADEKACNHTNPNAA